MSTLSVGLTTPFILAIAAVVFTHFVLKSGLSRATGGKRGGRGKEERGGGRRGGGRRGDGREGERREGVEVT